MLKGLKVIFVSCMAIGATSFAYQMINVQDIKADSQKSQQDIQTSAIKEIEELNNNQNVTHSSKPQNTNSTLSKEIDIEKAKQIALSKINGNLIKIEKDDDDYHVYIEKDGYKYDVEVDLYNGNIDDIDKEKVSSNQGITEEKAKQLALGKVNGKIIGIKTDDDDYKVYIEKDNYIYEIEIDRYRGTVDDVDKEKKPTAHTGIISKEKAIQIALSRVDGTVREIDYDDDDYQYDVTIVKDMIEYEIKIDAKSGGIDKVEKDD